MAHTSISCESGGKQHDTAIPVWVRRRIDRSLDNVRVGNTCTCSRLARHTARDGEPCGSQYQVYGLSCSLARAQVKALIARHEWLLLRGRRSQDHVYTAQLPLRVFTAAYTCSLPSSLQSLGEPRSREFNDKDQMYLFGTTSDRELTSFSVSVSFLGVGFATWAFGHDA